MKLPPLSNIRNKTYNISKLIFYIDRKFGICSIVLISVVVFGTITAIIRKLDEVTGSDGNAYIVHVELPTRGIILVKLVPT